MMTHSSFGTKELSFNLAHVLHKIMEDEWLSTDLGGLLLVEDDGTVSVCEKQPYESFGNAPLCALALQKGSHVISEVKVNCCLQEVCSHVFLVSKGHGKVPSYILLPEKWKTFRGCLVHCPPGQSPELISFIFSSYWCSSSCTSSSLSGIFAPLKQIASGTCGCALRLHRALPYNSLLSFPLLSLHGPLSWTAFPLAFPSSFLPQVLR